MRNPRLSNLSDIESGELILFSRPDKNGQMVTQIGFVLDICEDEENAEIVSAITVMPVVASDKAPNIKFPTFEINALTAEYCGLDTEHTVFCLGINIDAGNFANGKYQKIGFIIPAISEKIYQKADAVKAQAPKLFQFNMNNLTGFNLPHLGPAKLREQFPAHTSPTRTTSRYAQDSGHMPENAWDVSGPEMLVRDFGK